MTRNKMDSLAENAYVDYLPSFIPVFEEREAGLDSGEYVLVVLRNMIF